MVLNKIQLIFTHNEARHEKLIVPNNPSGYNNKDLNNAYKWQSTLSKSEEFSDVKVVVN